MISGVKIPDSKIAREAAELVRQHESEMLFNHSVRVFLFGAMKVADFPRGDFKNEFIEVQTCSALKKPLTTFGTVNFDYIEYRDPTFHKPNACTRIRNTPWLS